MQTILVLGGTKNARVLAEKLSSNYSVIYSIAGLTTAAILPKNCIRISGGFGGAEGLADYLMTNKVDFCIDATHPFAQNITRNIVTACNNTKTPHLQYARKAWQGDFLQFKTVDALIKTIPKTALVFLTIGSKNLEPYLRVEQISIARMIEKPEFNTGFKVILARPPFSFEQEISLMKKHLITHLICKNSGGDRLDNKLLAARELGVKVFMVAPPVSPHKIQFFSIDEIESYLHL